MKKLIILPFILSLFIIGCSSNSELELDSKDKNKKSDTQIEEQKPSRIDVQNMGNYINIVKDNQTGCYYIYKNSNGSSALTPMIKKDGSYLCD